MDAPTAAAIGSVCAVAISIVTVVGQVLLARQMHRVKDSVNGQSRALNELTASSSFAAGLESASRIPKANTVEGDIRQI